MLGDGVLLVESVGLVPFVGWAMTAAEADTVMSKRKMRRKDDCIYLVLMYDASRYGKE